MSRSISRVDIPAQLKTRDWFPLQLHHMECDGYIISANS
jgi:hypothetical protein